MSFRILLASLAFLGLTVVESRAQMGAGGGGGRPPSRIDMFIGRPNVVAMSEFYHVSTFGELEVDTLVLTDLNSNQAMTVMQMMYVHAGVSTSITMEQEEVEILAKGIDVFLKKSLNTTPVRPTTIDVMTRGGTAFRAVWVKEASGPGHWKATLALVAGGDMVAVPIDLGNLPAFVKALEQIRTEGRNLPSERR